LSADPKITAGPENPEPADPTVEGFMSEAREPGPGARKPAQDPREPGSPCQKGIRQSPMLKG